MLNICVEESWHTLKQESANFFCKKKNNKKLDSKYLGWVSGPIGLCHNYLALLLQCQTNDRQYINKWMWLCSNKTLFIDLKFAF